MRRRARPLGRPLGGRLFCGRFPHIDLSPIDLDAEEKRQRMVDRRYHRFFGNTGLVEKFERRGDKLIEMWRIAALVASPDLPKIRVIERFMTSVALGCFPVPGAGFRDYGDRDAVRDLIDLHNFNLFPAGDYVLRPSTSTVEQTPEGMRATRSTWARWLAALGRPVPIELQDVPAVAMRPTEAEVEVETEAGILFETASTSCGAAPAIPPMGEGELQVLYDARVTKAHAPTWQEDRSWAQEPSLIARGVRLKDVEKARANNPDERLHARHRRRG